MASAVSSASAAASLLPRGLRDVLVLLATAMVYAGVGWLSLSITRPLGFASPLYPPAGIALVVVLTYGRRALPAIWLGAFLVNTAVALQQEASDTVRLLAPLWIGLGVALQASTGAALVARHVSQPVVLNAPRDILRFNLLGGLVACLISPSVSTVTLLLTGALAPEAALSNWLIGWLGDTLGVLVAAPLVLSFIGLPRADWLPRRRTLALPLLIAMGLVAWGMLEFLRLDQQRLRASFLRDADHLAGDARLRLAQPLYALQALHGSARGKSQPDHQLLVQAASWWLAQPIELQAMSLSVRLAVRDLPAYEAAARRQDGAAFRVIDRDGGAARAADGEVVAIRHTEPLVGNDGAIGVNVMSIAETRAAVLATRDSGQPASTSALVLTQFEHANTGLAVYQALYNGTPSDLTERREKFVGVAAVVLRTERMLTGLAQGEQSYLKWCLVDMDTMAKRRRLAGPAQCENWTARRNDLHASPVLDLAGRKAELRVSAAVGQVPGRQREASSLLAVAGLAAVSLLGALLLTVTGHSRRTERAVQDSTAQLRQQIAERAQAEAALRSILDNVPLGVMFLDSHWRIIESNLRLHAALGLSAEQVRSTSVFDLVPPDQAPRLLAMRRTLLGHPHEPMAERLHLAAVNGHQRVVRITVGVLPNEGDRVHRLVCVVEDITENLRLEDAEKARDRAEAANRAKSEFVSRMSHELRTPLNAMIGFAQLLAMDKTAVRGEPQHGWVQHIQRAGWHLLEMIDETLDLARIESGSVEIKLVPLALEPLVGACLAMISSAAEQRRISVAFRIEPDVHTVLADEMRLKQVLTNLMSNAVKYNRDGGALTVIARRVRPAADDAQRGGRGAVEVAISDTGLGMTPEQLGALFQPYNRLGRESSGIEGTGIGLVISRSLAERMGGTLDAGSKAGVGSIFTLRLPEASSAQARPSGLRDLGPAPYRERRVHYVEDNETNIEVMRGVFAQRPQVLLETSMLGLAGVAAIRLTQPDLVLLDMQLHDISGVELLRLLKTDDAVAHIPVMMVSADGTPDNIRQALLAGALHHVTKPFNLTHFLALVDEVLASRPGASDRAMDD